MIILWFRQDLRIEDNLALNAALEQSSQTNQPILPLYILDDTNSGDHKMGAASRWWLHHSLNSLQTDLKSRYDLDLHVAHGGADKVLSSLGNIQAIHWNRCYEPWRIKRDTYIKETLKDNGTDVQSHNSSLLFEAPLINKADATPYKVFTPFYKKGCLAGHGQPREPVAAPSNKPYISAQVDTLSTDISSLNLMPRIQWYTTMEQMWQPSESGALNRLNHFLENGLNGYKEKRNHMNMEFFSKLSPHLHFGEISPNTVWYEASKATAAQGCEKDGEHFLSELGWREFSNNLLYNFPDLPQKNLQSKFDAFPWNDPLENDALKRWQKGQTGYPIVDAAMRELWQTGYMHNRARMIVGSFLVKHLRLHWHHGERWFWDTLLDADLANNSASWQWIAGCGADAAPYFRIFNPITQGHKFDQDGSYTRKYVPEVANLPDKYLFSPWEAPHDILVNAGITLGKDYPHPIVNHAEARESALAAFSSLKTVS